MGDITVVGKTTEEMVHRLCTADGLLEFLNDLSILWNYIVRIDSCGLLLFLSFFVQVALTLSFCL